MASHGMKALIGTLVLSLFLVCTGGVGWAQTLARMNVGVVGGGVAVSAGASYGEGNLLSERWGAQGTWAETTEGTYSITYNDTTNTGTGFASSQLKTVATADAQAYVSKDIGAQSAVYFRFYYILGSESWGNGVYEQMFTLGANGSNIGSSPYMNVNVGQSAAGQLQLFTTYAEGTESWDSGSSTYNISTGTIYKIEGKITDDGATGTAEWKVNGTVIGTKSGIASLGTVAVQDIHIGISYNGVASTHYFDTLDISSTGYLTDTP